MTKETQEQVGTMAKAREPSVGLVSELFDVLRRRVEEVSLHVAVAVLPRVQLRGVARQLLHHDLGMFAQIRLHRGATMHLQAVPDQQEWTRDPALEVP